MTNLTTNYYVTVIADGSDKEVVDKIRFMFDLVTKREIGSTPCRPLSKSHPTTIVIETETNKERYEAIQEIVEVLYPGLCLFNVRIA